MGLIKSGSNLFLVFNERKLSTLTIEQDAGNGRPFLIVYEENAYSDLVHGLFEVISKETRTVLIKSPLVTNKNWKDLSQQLRELLSQQGIRQASFISFAAASALVLNLSLLELKLIRSIVVIDAGTRPHPTWFDRFTDKIENILPLGLPLRSFSTGFDAKSFLQRIRCPILAVITKKASHFIKSQAHVLRDNLPTCWVQELSIDEEVNHLNRLVSEFQKVAAKCPQKKAA